MIGIITGRRIAKNRDGDMNRILLQVEIIKDEDVRTIELISQAGEDTNPANGCRVNIIPISNSYHVGIGVTDDLQPQVDPGEKEFYSTDNPVTQKKARLKLDKNSNVVLNSGVNHAAQYEALKTAFEELKGKFDNHTHPYINVAAPATTSPTTTPSIADITLAKIDTVKTP